MNSNLLNIYRMMGKKGGEVPPSPVLPEGYTQLEYLHGTKASYIDTGYRVHNSDVLSVKFNVRKVGNNNNVVLGWRWAGGAGGSQHCFIQATGDFRKIIVGSVDKDDFPNDYENTVVIDFSSRQRILNGVALLDKRTNYVTPFDSTGVSPQNLYLFALNGIGTPIAFALDTKIYAFSIHRGGMEVIDYIPCLNPDGVAGMYDLVGGKFYGSATSTPFIPGGYIQFEDPEVERICVQNWSSDGVGLTYEDAANVTEIPREVFSGNTKIKTFDEFRYFIGVKGFNSYKQQINKCTNLESITLPPSLTYLGEETFWNNGKMNVKGGLDNIKSLIYGSNFRDSGLSGSLNMPNLEGRVQQKTFENTKITEIKSLGNATYLMGDAFKGCRLLKKARIPKTVTNISWNVFANTALETLILEATTPTILDEGSPFIGVDTDKMYIYVPDASVDAYKTAPVWSNYADKIKPINPEPEPKYIQFEDPEVERLCIANFSSDGVGVTKADAEKVTEIGRTLKSAKTFNEFIFFTGVTKLSNSFEDAVNLTSIVLPQNLVTLGDSAFWNANKLESINLENITDFGANCFRVTPSLKINAKLSSAKTIYTKAFNSSGILSVEMGEGTETIGISAFELCSNLQYAVLPSTIKTIDSYAFISAKKMEYVVCKATNPPVLNTNVFDGALKAIYVPDTSVDTYKAAPNWSKYAAKIKPLSQYVEPVNK